MTAYKSGHCPDNVYLRGAGESTVIDGVRQMVGRPCGILRNGQWYCEAHDFKTSMDARSWAHTQEVGAHVMVWICRVHGAEQPGE